MVGYESAWPIKLDNVKYHIYMLEKRARATLNDEAAGDSTNERGSRFR
jgi:hypothetical protein